MKGVSRGHPGGEPGLAPSGLARGIAYPTRPPRPGSLPTLHPRVASATVRQAPGPPHPSPRQPPPPPPTHLPFHTGLLNSRQDALFTPRMSALQRAAHLIRSGVALPRPRPGSSRPGTARDAGGSALSRSARFPHVPGSRPVSPAVSRKKRASLANLLLTHAPGEEDEGDGGLEFLSLTGNSLASLVNKTDPAAADPEAGHAAVGVDDDGGETESESGGSVDLDDGADYEEIVTDGLQSLRGQGVRIIDGAELQFGDCVDSGAFGVVHRAVWRSPGKPPMNVAVKTSERDDSFGEVWEMFELEARMAWQASAGQTDGVLAHICKMYGVAVTGLEDAIAGGPRPKVHMVMELLDCSGDIHDIIHGSDQWVQVRNNGLDTGAKLRKGLIMRDGNDVYMYVMDRQLKIEISLGLARGMKELRASKVLHCDLKPANAVLHTIRGGRHPEYRLGKVVKLIDFGEANVLPDAKGDVAGTAGYMSPEMEESGDATHESDMYSCGVTLLELWCGCIGPTFEEYAGLSYGTAAACGRRAFRKVRQEITTALSRLDKIEPEVAALIRRCVATNPGRRPLPGTLIRVFKRLSKSSAHLTTNSRVSKRGSRRMSSSGYR